MKKTIICIIILVFAFFLFWNGNENEKIIDHVDTTDYTSDDATQMFKDMYGMSNLVKQNIYINKDTLYADFYYSGEASESELDTGRSFVLVNLILGKVSPYGDIPYRNLIDPLFKEISWNETICNIYR